jgi:probable HAF family extracellular repeat protein
MRRFVLFVVGLALLAGVVAAMSGGTQAEAGWVITDLGTLPGDKYSEAVAVNDRGQIVGVSYADYVGYQRHAFLWENGTMIDLGGFTLGGPTGRALAINDRGQIVGTSETKSGYEHAFLWQSGRLTDLGTLPGKRWSRASATNERGQIVGSSGRADSLRGFLWENGKMIDLATLAGGRKAEALAINERGTIAGWSGTGAQRHAVLWKQGKTIDLGALPGLPISFALAINNRGQVLGRSYRPGGKVHEVLWQSGKIVDLGVSDRLATEAAINNRGQIVLNHPFEGAVLWEKGTVRTLGSLGGGYTGPSDINDRGQIVGESAKGKPAHAPVRAFLWQRATIVDLETLPGKRDSQANAISERGHIVGWSGNEYMAKRGTWHAARWTLLRNP